MERSGCTVSRLLEASYGNERRKNDGIPVQRVSEFKLLNEFWTSLSLLERALLLLHRYPFCDGHGYV
jgi:hypothetical protein